MDINRLRYFCTVASTGSIRQAADLLGISAPALSKAIQKLEDEVGVELLLNRGRNIFLSDAG